VVSVPSSIDATGRTDVSGAFAVFLASVPDNRVIQLAAGGQYRMESTLVVSDRHGLTLDGNGARIFATTRGDRERANLRLLRGSDITIENLWIQGANPDGGVGGIFDLALEAQHGIDIQGTRNTTVRNTTITDPYGDFINMQLDYHDGWTDGVHIVGNHFERSGRQGITITAARNVVVENNTMTDMRRATFDFEPGRADRWGADNVLIRNNDIGPGQLNFIAAAGQGPVDDVTIQGNHLHGQALQVFMHDTAGGIRRNWKVLDNTSDLVFNAPHQAAMRFWRVSGLQVSGNHQPFTKGFTMYGTWTQDSCGLALSGNDYANATGQSLSVGGC